MARLFLQVILLVALVAVLDCAPASPPPPQVAREPPVPPRAQQPGISTTAKPRQARQAQQPNPPPALNPLQSVPSTRTNQPPTTTVRPRPARASDNEGKQADQPSPLLYGTQLDGNERAQEDRSTTPKSRPARATGDEDKSHDAINPLAASSQAGRTSGDREDHSRTSTPKSRPVRAADDVGKPREDQRGQSTTPKSRPARQTGSSGKPDEKQERPTQAVPLAKLGNTEHSTTQRSRTARQAPRQGTGPGANPAQGGHEREGSDKKEEGKSKEHRHTRDTEGPQDAPKDFHILVRGEPVPINLDQQGEDKIKQNQPERKTRDTQPKKDEHADRVGTGTPPRGAQVQPTRPLAAHQARQRRDEAKATTSKPGTPSQPNTQGQNRAPVPLTSQANPQNAPPRRTRDTAEKKDAGSASGTPRQFASSHGPTQGDLANIRRAQEQQQKQG